jgi:hypothetical protein
VVERQAPRDTTSRAFTELHSAIVCEPLSQYAVDAKEKLRELFAKGSSGADVMLERVTPDK